MIFTTSAVLQIALYALVDGGVVFSDYLIDGNGLSHIAGYPGATILGCVGYGSVFLAAGACSATPSFPPR